ncbi:DUF1871 family protein [Paenibacillus luteus]|uniref:DUF1871 family protein n=1 Tax=Paenibacillus luteus TaxID=2545753 RepID=UPI0011417FCF|nr:DUF1871 family protein [Paenibacillus luteus]
MKEIVKQVIDAWNPYGLLPDAPEDEFDSEIRQITAKLMTSESMEELALHIQKVFTTSFDDNFNYNNCLDAASRIWTLSKESQRTNGLES